MNEFDSGRRASRASAPARPRRRRPRAPARRRSVVGGTSTPDLPRVVQQPAQLLARVAPTGDRQTARSNHGSSPTFSTEKPSRAPPARVVLADRDQADAALLPPHLLVERRGAGKRRSGRRAGQTRRPPPAALQVATAPSPPNAPARARRSGAGTTVGSFPAGRHSTRGGGVLSGRPQGAEIDRRVAGPPTCEEPLDRRVEDDLVELAQREQPVPPDGRVGRGRPPRATGPPGRPRR